MPHKLFIIEHASSPLQGDWESAFRQANSTVGRRREWNSFLPEQLGSCSEDLLLANAASGCEEPLRLFRWLRDHPLRIPTLAILPEGNHEMLQAAAAAVDDFLLAPVKHEELRHRLARLLTSKAGRRSGIVFVYTYVHSEAGAWKR